MGLKEYKSKRKFGETPEPHAGEQRSRGGLIFVVHKHAARHLHYDLRLELEGVLKSWAIPKGPSMDPSVKRLAVMVEDHPYDYKDFEGMIPEGNYGAGSVIIWDRGAYHHPSEGDQKESEKLLLEGLKKGDLKFVLEGEKLRGEFALVRTRMDDKSWLLIKKKDQHATKNDILTENKSVYSGKTLEEITASDPDKAFRQKKIDQIHAREELESAELKDAPVRPMPHNIQPMLATLVKGPFDDPDWLFEVKWDGYRAIAEIGDGHISLYSRNLLSLSKKFQPVAESLRKFRFDAVLDGEIVAVDDQGRADFQMLQDYQRTGKGNLVYYVFDLIYFGGRDLTDLPLVRRKEVLKKILPHAQNIKFSDHVMKDGILFFNVAQEKGLEGIMAKHSQGKYRTGARSKHWLKIKTRLTQEGVIAGFTEPKGSRRYLGSLVLGVYAGDDFVFIGHSGGGFGTGLLKEIFTRLKPLVQDECPFAVAPVTNSPATWVKPQLVCEVAFQGWTDEGLMRQPVFLRLRDDKNAREVVRENSEEK